MPETNHPLSTLLSGGLVTRFAIRKFPFTLLSNYRNKEPEMVLDSIHISLKPNSNSVDIYSTREVKRIDFPGWGLYNTACRQIDRCDLVTEL